MTTQDMDADARWKGPFFLAGRQCHRKFALALKIMQDEEEDRTKKSGCVRVARTKNVLSDGMR